MPPVRVRSPGRLADRPWDRSLGILVDGEFNLGLLHIRGSGVPQDDRAAYRWFLAAAKQGLTEAQVRAGAMSAAGRGVRADRVEAARWYLIAGRAGNAGALRRLEALGPQLSTAERKAAEERATAWERARAERAR